MKLVKDILHVIASRYGKTCSWETMWKVISPQEKDPVKAFIEELQLPMTEQEYVAASKALYEEHFSKTEILPGVETLVNHLHAHGVPFAIATGSRKEAYDIKSRNFQDMMKKFHHVVCGTSDDEVKLQKPAPDVFIVCNSRFENPPPPEKVLVIEDAPIGVRAAVSAGMQVVMVPDSRLDPELCKEASLVLRSLEDFRPELFGLPPFANT